MAYNQNIPQPTDALKVSQADVLANFQELFTFFGVNHQNFGQLDAGKHKFLQMPVQVAAPGTSPTETALYSAIGATSGVPELVFRRASNGTVIPFTEGTNAAQGWTRLPSGLVMKWNVDILAAATVNMNITHNMALIGPVLSVVFWGTTLVASSFLSPNTDVDAVSYTVGLSTAQIDYRLWRRTVAGTQPNNDLRVYGLLLGVQ